MWSGLNFPSQWLIKPDSLVTGRPTGTNLFVGAVLYLSAPWASQWHWNPEDVESERPMDDWLNGLFICWGRVKGHSSTVGIAWCSQSWRDLWLFIPDLMTCFIIFIWFRELDTLSGWCCCIVTYQNNLIWRRKFNGPSLFNFLTRYPYPISTFTLVNSWENKLVWPLSWRV